MAEPGRCTCGPELQDINQHYYTACLYRHMTTVVLEGEYNMPLEITITAENCAGTSEEVAEVVHVGMCVSKNNSNHKCLTHFIILYTCKLIFH